jgi:hypothetical protein
MGGKPALEATEMGLIATVALVAETAGATGARGVARVDVDHAHAACLRLVGDKGAQLEESPRAVLPPLLATNMLALTNPRQVFESQRLADEMVDVPLEPRFAPGDAPQTRTRPAGVSSLEAPWRL